MKKRARILVIAVGLSVVFVAAGVVVLPALVALNQVKGEIAKTLTQATGRTVTIRRLSLSLFPWLGIRLTGATLGNAPGFGPAPLARVSDAVIEVRVLPLFSRHIVLRRVVLDGLDVNLEEDRAGATNWATLTHGAKAAPRSPAASRAEEREAPAFRLLRAAGLVVSHARIRYRNARTGARDTLSDLALRLGTVVPGRPVAVRLHATLKTAGRPPIPFRLTAKAAYRAPVFTFSPLRLTIAGLTAHGRLQVVRAPAGLTADGHLTIPPFAPRPLLAALGIPYTPRDPTALKQASGALAFRWSPAVLRLAPLSLTLDGTTMTGTITRTAQPLLYQADLAVTRLRPMRYWPAAAPPPPAAHPAPAAAQPGPAPAPPPFLHTPLVAAITCGRLRIHGLVATNLRARIRSSGGRIVLAPLAMDLYQGRFTGAIQAALAGSPQTWQVHGRLSHVQVSQVARALHLFPEFSGSLDAHIRLRGAGTTLATAERTATGRLSAAIPNGVLRGLDLDAIAEDPKAAAGAHKAAADQGTAFSGLHASATVDRGVVHTSALVLHTARAAIHGHGDLTLATKTVDYLLNVALPSGLVIPVRVQGPAGHIRFSVSLNQLLQDSSPNGLHSALKTLGGALRHAFGLH